MLITLPTLHNPSALPPRFSVVYYKSSHACTRNIHVSVPVHLPVSLLLCVADDAKPPAKRRKTMPEYVDYVKQVMAEGQKEFGVDMFVQVCFQTVN